MSFGNMFISSKKVFDEYSEWLFDILERYSLEMRNRQKDMPPRLLGYIAEVLLNVWFITNVSKIKYCFTFNVDKNTKGKLYHVKRFLIQTKIFPYVEDFLHYLYRLKEGY